MSGEVPLLSIVKKGTNVFPRYVVTKADEYRNPIYWTGSNWTANEDAAMLFDDVTDALWAYHDLLTESVADRPCHQYIAPLFIRIYGEKPKLSDLRQWLERAVRIVVDTPKHGLGPTGTVGLLIADFRATEENK
jgi:hypothetical protein